MKVVSNKILAIRNGRASTRRKSSCKVKTLDELYKGDLELLALYKKNLLVPGWAGELALYELAYIRSELEKSARLKKLWGFRPSAKRLSEKRIMEVARNGVKRT